MAIPTIRITPPTPQSKTKGRKEPALFTLTPCELVAKCIELFHDIMGQLVRVYTGEFNFFFKRLRYFRVWWCPPTTSRAFKNRVRDANPTTVILVRLGLTGLTKALQNYANPEVRASRGAEEIMETIDSYMEKLQAMKL